MLLPSNASSTAQKARVMSQEIAQRAMQRGLAAHQAGDVATAEAAYREALAAAPEDAGVLSLLGLALAHQGRPAEGVAYLENALDKFPGHPGLALNLVEALIPMGAVARAESLLRQVLAADARNPQAWNRLGDVLAYQGKDAEAQDAWVTALDLDHTLPNPATKIARLLLGAGQAGEALIATAPAFEQHPRHPGLRHVRGEALSLLREWAPLEALAKQWVEVEPQDPQGWRHLSRATFEQGRIRQAMEAFATSLTSGQPTALEYAAYAGICLHALDLDAAAKALDQAEALDPNLAVVALNRATLALYHGHFAEAEAACRRCLAADPLNAAAYTLLTRLNKGQLTATDVAQLEALVASPTHFDFRIPAAFSLAHAAEARDDLDAALAAFERAHALCLDRDTREERQHKPAEEAVRLGKLRQLAATAPAVAPKPAERARPVFIVGMPRSGTTLLEAVLGAHSQVLACGERTVLPQVQRAWLAVTDQGGTVDDAMLAHWREAYLAGIPTREGADHFTDKQPLNYESVGLLLQLFPDAAVVHVRRNPVETALSIWRQEFSKQWAFTHRWEDIAAQYGRYARLMQHYEQALPGRIVTVQYEDFAGDFANAAPRLLEALGLPFEEQCLRFQEVARPITTFSAVEAREPVAVRSGRAARYGARLQPLVDALAAEGIDLATGALA